MSRLVLAAGAVALLVLSGCAYDYLQRTDRVAYQAGDAVKANLESQTTDPFGAAKKDKTGLGKNGVVVPQSASAP